ncbi:MAG: bifunctional hydroxymethylpyrimidine kinase/phosphomethylpyrimidine kinase, partial [Oscillospiraceae bacterium]
MKNLLTIAGSDSCGGAGIQADIKTFSAHGCYAMSVITAITAQNTVAVNAVLDTTPEMIKEQLDAIFTDIRVDGVKIGMVSAAPAIKVIVEGIKKYAPPIVVVDPVMVSTSGFNLLNPAAIDTLIHTLLPRATIITPNIPEAEILANMKIRTTADIETSAKIIHGIGAK